LWCLRLSIAALCRIAIGIGFGLAAVLWLGVVFNDTLIEITITLTSAYMVYFVVSMIT
jgi:hypothetical protein